MLEAKSGKGKESETAGRERVGGKASGKNVAAAVTTNFASCGFGIAGTSTSSVELPVTEQQLRFRDLWRGQIGEIEGWASVELTPSGGQQL